MSVFVLDYFLWDYLVNSISTLQVASCQKTQRIAVMEASKQTGSEIADSTPT